MLEVVLAQMMHEERQRDTPPAKYRRQWEQMRTLDRLEAKLRLSKQRLGLLQREPDGLRDQSPEAGRAKALGPVVSGQS